MYFYVYDFFCIILRVWYLQRPDEDTGSQGTGVTEGSELPRGCWKLNARAASARNHQTTSPALVNGYFWRSGFLHLK